MKINRHTISTIILLSLPFQFNLNVDSLSMFLNNIKHEWVNGRELSYYENYFLRKILYYIAFISAISFVFIYYRIKKLRSMVSLGFYIYAFTWLLYFAVDENRIHVLFIIRGLQGVFHALFQVSFVTYIYHFIQPDHKCFYGCFFQFMMFFGLLLLNLLFYLTSWKTVSIVLFMQASVFGSLIWFVPDVKIKPKSISKESIFSKAHLKCLLVMLMLMILQQLSGIGVLLGQFTEILISVGLNIDNHLQAIMFDFVGVISTFIAAFITDTISTRYMWCLSAFGLCISLIIYGITLKIELPKWVAILGVFIFFLFFGLGEGQIPWYISGTFFPEEVRIESSAICICLHTFLSPILDLLWDFLYKKVGLFGSIVFCCVICFCSIFLGLLIPIEYSKKIDSISII